MPTEEQIEAAALAIRNHSLGENWGDDGVGFVGCDCGLWFGKALDGAWQDAIKHVAEAALRAAEEAGPWEYGWAADEERRADMTPRGPRILHDDHPYTPEEIAATEARASASATCWWPRCSGRGSSGRSRRRGRVGCSACSATTPPPTS